MSKFLATKYVSKGDGSGWWLHVAGAVAIMAVGWWTGWLLTALIINTALWPARELWQKRKEPRRFFTFHVLLEWLPAVAVGGIIYGVLE
jgi:hypothetical protein